METSNTPEDEIKHFQELKKAFEEQPLEEPQLSETNPPELSEEQLKEDFASNLERIGIPAAEREQMLEPFNHQSEPIIENTDVAPLSPNLQ
jgi:hypothetical protein